MKDPKRLEFTKNAFCDMGCDCGLMPDPVECKDGRFVFWDDYARLKAEVERLRKAGDALEFLVCFNYEGDINEDEHSARILDAWSAAKDGKTSE